MRVEEAPPAIFIEGLSTVLVGTVHVYEAVIYWNGDADDLDYHWKIRGDEARNVSVIGSERTKQSTYRFAKVRDKVDIRLLVKSDTQEYTVEKQSLQFQMSENRSKLARWMAFTKRVRRRNWNVLLNLSSKIGRRIPALNGSHLKRKQKERGHSRMNGRSVTGSRQPS